MKPDRWYHVELIREGKFTSIYIDNKLRYYTADDPDIIQNGRRIGLIHYSGTIAFDTIEVAELK